MMQDKAFDLSWGFSLLKRIDVFRGHVTPVTSDNHEKLGISDPQNIVVKILLLTVQWKISYHKNFCVRMVAS